MDKGQRVVVIGAGVFGLTTALQLAQTGYRNVVVLDRHVPPVPDGSSVDISRVVRFDYGDDVYTRMAWEAYQLWSTSTLFKGVFYPSPFALAATNDPGRQYVDRCIASLEHVSLPYRRLHDIQETKRIFPTLTGQLGNPGFYGYCNFQAGWVDAYRAIARIRDQCIEAGVSFIAGAGGTVTRLQTRPGGTQIVGVETADGNIVPGDVFILAAGAWSSRLVSMYNTTLATAQVVGFLNLTAAEMERYKELPIYINFTSGFFSFPPHPDAKCLKVAVHGWGYTRTDEIPSQDDPTGYSRTDERKQLSAPGLAAKSRRPNFAPRDGLDRLYAGVNEILPELAGRKFDRAAVCWYSDTPTGDFIMDYHPDHKNLFLATGGSGHAFKFLPVLGKYVVGAMARDLPGELLHKWAFRIEYRNETGLFKGDGSRGGPARREFSPEERAKL